MVGAHLEVLGDDTVCAPHVLARLIATVGDDRATVREVLGRLDRAQRQGLRALPESLPLVTSVPAGVTAVDLTARDRALVLACSLALDDRLGPLLAFDGRSADEIATSAVGRHLRLHAGRMRLTDPRLAWRAVGGAHGGDLSRAHRRMAAVLATEDPTAAAWHRARGSLEARPALARELLDAAGSRLVSGDAETAWRFAREGGRHADGAVAEEAALRSGAAALGAGFLGDAADALASLFPRGTERARCAALGPLITTQTLLRGAVPDVDPWSLSPRRGSRGDWRAWSRAAGIAAVLCAERGDRSAMRGWLAALHDGVRRTGDGRLFGDAATALSWVLAGEPATAQVSARGPVSGGLLRALQAALRDDADLGLRLLTAEEAMPDAERDPLVPGYERTPIVLAYRAVAEALLRAWRGELARAREGLIEASVDLPVALPFAGLGAVLARRLDLAVVGEVGPFARALTAAVPSAAGADTLLDGGIRSFLAGSFEEAAASVALWAQRGSPHPTMASPGLEEVAVTGTGRTVTAETVVPPEIARAQRLRVRIATAGDGQWGAVRDGLHAEARSLRSPFARGRVETMLGIRHALRDERAEARAHFLRAVRLFDLSGAAAWSASVHARLGRLGAAEGAPGVEVDPLSTCRWAWAEVLTPRELEVAMRAVEGASNRDIARELTVSVRTVEVHLGRVFTKLDVRNRIELAGLAHRTNRYR